MRPFIFTLLLGCVLIATPMLRAEPKPVTPPSSTATTPAEAELGAKVAEQVEKEFKLIKDDKTIERLQAIAARIAPVTQRPDVVYKCKILDTPMLNAMAIPGGTVYVTKGLLDAVESDSELAGVMAHEIAHNSLYHAKRMAEHEARASIGELLTIIASIYANKNSEVSTGQFIMMSELVKQALVNGYTTELEAEADRNGMLYLWKTKYYEPAGLYSVILGFRQEEMSHPKVEWGYLKTHPYSEERKTNLEQEMKELDIVPNLWRVINFHAEVVPVEDGKKGYTVKLGAVDVATFTVADGEKDAKARATAAVNAINRRLNKSYVQQFEVLLDFYDNQAEICLPSVPVITFTQADATAASVSLEYLGTRTKANIQNAIMREKTKRSW